MYAHWRAISKDVCRVGKNHSQARRLGKHLSALYWVLCTHNLYSRHHEERACKDCSNIGLHFSKCSLILRIEQRLRLSKVWKQAITLHSACTFFDLLIQNHLRKTDFLQNPHFMKFSIVLFFLDRYKIIASYFFYINTCFNCEKLVILSSIKWRF